MLHGRESSPASARGVLATLVGLLLLALVPVPSFPSAASETVERLRRTVKTRGLSAADREAATVGYYQELLNSASGVVVRTPAALDTLMAGGGPADGGRPALEEVRGTRLAFNDVRRDFLVYRPRPHLDAPDPRFPGIHIVTNAHGFADGEYAEAREPGTRRFVLLGDSVPRGMGVPVGSSFEALLEGHLNAQAEGGVRFEIINMAVSGYRFTQTVDVALETAPRFSPDVYIVALSWLSVGDKWGLHLAQLVEDGIDLKYDALRDVVRDSGLRKGDPAGTAEAKLTPFFEPTLRWGLRAIDRHARESGGSLLVLLVPHLKGLSWFERGSASLEHEFRPVRAVLEAEGIPYVDALDAFDRRDPAGLDAGDGLHPNVEGHRILFETIHDRIAGDPALSELVQGAPAAAASIRR